MTQVIAHLRNKRFFAALLSLMLVWQLFAVAPTSHAVAFEAAPMTPIVKAYTGDEGATADVGALPNNVAILPEMRIDATNVADRKRLEATLKDIVAKGATTILIPGNLVRKNSVYSLQKAKEIFDAAAPGVTVIYVPGEAENGPDAKSVLAEKFGATPATTPLGALAYFGATGGREDQAALAAFTEQLAAAANAERTVIVVDNLAASPFETNVEEAIAAHQQNHKTLVIKGSAPEQTVNFTGDDVTVARQKQADQCPNMTGKWQRFGVGADPEWLKFSRHSVDVPGNCVEPEQGPALGLSSHDANTNPPFTGSNTVYPYGADAPASALPAAPAGYKQSYFATFVRHGSRALSRSSHYDGLITMLNQAEQAGQITQRGKDLRTYLTSLKAVQEQVGGGNLSTRGRNEMSGYGQRLATRHADLLATKNGTIRLESSSKERAIDSAKEISAALSRSLRPEVTIPANPTQNKRVLQDFDEKNSPTQKARDAYLKSDRTYKNVEKLPENLRYPGAREAANNLLSDFVSPEFAARQLTGYCGGKAASIFETRGASVTLSADGAAPYPQVNTEAAREIQRCTAIDEWYKRSLGFEGQDVTYNNGKPVLKDFFDSIDASKTGSEVGSVRSGHNETLTPLNALLEVPGVRQRATANGPLFNYKDYDFRQSETDPMGGNIEWVVYKNRQGRTLVLTLLNENPIPLGRTCKPIAEGSLFYEYDHLKACLPEVGQDRTPTQLTPENQIFEPKYAAPQAPITAGVGGTVAAPVLHEQDGATVGAVADPQPTPVTFAAGEPQLGGFTVNADGTITVAATAPAGTHNVTVVATYSDNTTDTVTVPVTVNKPQKDTLEPKYTAPAEPIVAGTAGSVAAPAFFVQDGQTVTETPANKPDNTAFAIDPGLAGFNIDAATGAITVADNAPVGAHNVTVVVTYPDGSKDTVTVPVNVKNPVYTVTFESNGGTPVDVQQVEKGNKATEPAAAPTREGHKFLGWFTEAEGTTSFNFDAPVTANATAHAKWEKNQYTVTFNANGGALAAGAQDTVQVEHGTPVAKPADPTREGHTFAGWTAETPATATSANYEFSTAVTAPVTLTAKWTKNTYAVKFDANGGTGAPGDVQVTHGEGFTKPAQEPTREGYNFAGWATTAEGTTDYNFASPVNGATTLFAKWTKKQYAVKFDANGGALAAGTQDTVQVEHGTTVTEPAAKPTRAGHTFAGWATDAAGANVYDFKAPVTGAVTLFAKWTKDPFTVTFNTQGGSAVPAGTTNAEGKVTAPAAPTRDGFTFVKWTKDAAGQVEFDFNTAVTENTTLFAQWQRNTYTVKFDTQGGSAVADATTNAEGKISKPGTDPTKADHKFLGWTTDAAGNADFDFNTVLTADTTLYAKWEKNAPVVTPPGVKQNTLVEPRYVAPAKPFLTGKGGTIATPQFTEQGKNTRVQAPADVKYSLAQGVELPNGVIFTDGKVTIGADAAEGDYPVTVTVTYSDGSVDEAPLNVTVRDLSKPVAENPKAADNKALTVTANPKGLFHGESTVFRAEGFRMFEKVSVYVASEPKLIAIVLADVKGVVEVKWTATAEFAPGDHTVIFVGRETGQGRDTFKIAQKPVENPKPAPLTGSPAIGNGSGVPQPGPVPLTGPPAIGNGFGVDHPGYAPLPGPAIGKDSTVANPGTAPLPGPAIGKDSTVENPGQAPLPDVFISKDDRVTQPGQAPLPDVFISKDDRVSQPGQAPLHDIFINKSDLIQKPEGNLPGPYIKADPQVKDPQPTAPVKPEQSAPVKVNKDEKKLPDTGSESLLGYALAASLLLATGGAILVRRRVKR